MEAGSGASVSAFPPAAPRRLAIVGCRSGRRTSLAGDSSCRRRLCAPGLGLTPRPPHVTMVSSGGQAQPRRVGVVQGGKRGGVRASGTIEKGGLRGGVTDKRRRSLG